MKGKRMKAILVAGGEGSRLLPFTRYTHKTLLPLHSRPVIDYALGTIRRTGIADITIIGNRFIGQIAQHVGVGLEGENIHYVIEEEPRGVGHALNLARPHVEGHRLLIYFSDNITSAELKEEVDVDKVISILYKNLKKFSKEQDRTIKKLSRGQDIDEDLYDALVGTAVSKKCFRAFLGEL